MELIVWLICIGVVAGTVGSLIGLGGGIIIVPALLFLSEWIPSFEMTPSLAVGTSLVLVILTALSSTHGYAKEKRVDFHSGWVFFATCGPGAVFGAYLTRFFQADLFFIAYGLLMVIIALILFLKDRFPRGWIQYDVERTFTDLSGETYRFGYHRWTALIVSFVVGFISGLFGVGGGSLLVPMMMILFQYPPHIATATSMFTILLTSIIGSFTHLFQGNIDWYAVLFLAPGAWIGGKCGVWISKKLTSRGLLNLLRFAFLFIAFRMMVKGLHLI